MRRVKILKLILLILLVCAPGVYGDEIIRSIIPASDSFKKIESPFEYYEIYKKSKLIGYCFNTKDIVPEKQGYSGPMEILVGIDKDCRIVNVKILSHSETLEYASGITEEGFLGQFRGKGPGDNFKIGDDIDSVTHATVSSAAVCDILKAGIKEMQNVLVGSRNETPATEMQLKIQKKGLEPREAKYYKVIDE